MKKLTLTLTIALTIILKISAQTQQDTIYNYITSTPVVVDGVDTEDCWDNADWYDISVVWLPYLNAPMDAGDFEGRFKVAWDAEYLYLLVEVVDNMISDDHADPLDSWWDDDCVEIFIDEDRSKGWHENDENAFAYHVSLSYDAIDMDASGGINYKDHIDVVMNDQGDNTYLWELAIKIYADDYDHSSPEASRVTLVPEKVMGFTLAYCDNDETTSRENFIGSMNMHKDSTNVNYQTADYFGSMKLIDPDYVPVGIEASDIENWIIYPVPSKNQIKIKSGTAKSNHADVSLFNTCGQLVQTASYNTYSFSLDISHLEDGVYLLKINSEVGSVSKMIVKSS